MVFEWWTGARYDRDGDVLIVRRARLLAALAGLSAALATLVILWGPGTFGSWFRSWVGPVWLVASSVALAQWRIPPVVADRAGIRIRRLRGDQALSWEEVVAYEMRGSYGWSDFWVALRARGREVEARIVGPSLTVLPPSQVRELRDLGRRLAQHGEALGHGPRPWPQATRFLQAEVGPPTGF